MLKCGVGAKSVAHLMKYHLLQWEVVKVKRRPVKLSAGPVTECAFARWRKVYHFLSGHNDVIASFSCLILLRPLVS